jgi:hypothetical protein
MRLETDSRKLILAFLGRCQGAGSKRVKRDALPTMRRTPTGDTGDAECWTLNVPRRAIRPLTKTGHICHFRNAAIEKDH